MKYQVHYVRIEHQIYTLEVEADSYNVVHAEEYIHNVTPLQEQTA